VSATFSQRCRHDSEIPKSFAICRNGCVAPTGDGDHAAAERRRERLRHAEHPPATKRISTGQETTYNWAVPTGVIWVGGAHQYTDRKGDPSACLRHGDR
jgi:hypothetical protein